MILKLTCLFYILALLYGFTIHLKKSSLYIFFSLAFIAAVGFHAYVESTKTIAEGVVWVYDKVVTNTHNAYSATTGKFTTPEQGLYMFSYSTVSDPGKWSHAGLYVNGKIRSWQNCSKGGGKNQWLTSSNTAILLLQKGDVVYVASFHFDATIRESLSDFSGAKLN